MNDRFKFRVWLPDENRYLHNTDCPVVDSDGNLMWCYLNPFGHWEHHKMENAVIEQSSGLVDKNGKLIYEGDVVLALESWSGRKRKFNVIYCDKEYGFLFVDDFKNTKALFAFLPKELEIIGNIHEMEVEK